MLPRRLFLTLLSLPLLPRHLRAADVSATVDRVEGEGEAMLPDGSVVALSPGLRLPPGSQVLTGGDGRAALVLDDGARVNAGRATRIRLSATESSGAGLNVSGLAVVDRRATWPGSETRVQSDGFEVLMANARVFIDSVGDQAVFVKEGKARVDAGPDRVILAAGEGVDLAAPRIALAPPPPKGGRPPSPARPPRPARPPVPAPAPAPAPPPGPVVRRWSDERIARAFAQVGLEV